MSSQIDPIHTPCKKCVFASYENNTQIACHLDYLDRYKNNNVEILEVYDEEKEFFVINKKKCIGYRENKWFDQFNLSNGSIEDKIQKYKENEYIRYIAVVDLKDMDLEELESVCVELSKTSIKPQKLIIIRYLSNKEQFKYNDIESLLKTTNIGCQWRIQTILDEEAQFIGIMHDVLKNNKKSRFVLTIKKMSTKISTIIDYANNKVYNELDTLLACGDKDRHGVLCSATTYRYAIENQKDIINDKEIFIEL